MKPHVYIFRGAPASGKGALVPEFAKSLPKPVVLIELDKLRWGFHLIGRSVDDITSEEHRMAYENTILLYERYLKSGKYTIVVEGLFTWNNEQSNEGSATQLLKLASENGFGASSIVLTADKNELTRRNNERPYSVPKGEFETLYDGVYGTVDHSEIVIDSTGESLEETIVKLKRIL
jgi:predicted kinase